MRPTVSQYAEALAELVAEATPAAVSATVDRYIDFLKHRGEIYKLEAITKRLESMEMGKENRMIVVATTAHEITASIKEMLTAKARLLFPNKHITMRYEVDTRLIGGARFQTDETLYDTTLSASLDALQQSLVK